MFKKLARRKWGINPSQEDCKTITMTYSRSKSEMDGPKMEIVIHATKKNLLWSCLRSWMKSKSD